MMRVSLPEVSPAGGWGAESVAGVAAALAAFTGFGGRRREAGSEAERDVFSPWPGSGGWGECGPAAFLVGAGGSGFCKGGACGCVRGLESGDASDCCGFAVFSGVALAGLVGSRAGVGGTVGWAGGLMRSLDSTVKPEDSLRSPSNREGRRGRTWGAAPSARWPRRVRRFAIRVPPGEGLRSLGTGRPGPLQSAANMRLAGSG